MAKSKEQELAIRIAGKVDKTFKQSIGLTEEGLQKIASTAKKAAAIAGSAFTAIKVGGFISDSISEYSEFEQAMANTASIAQATAEEYEALTTAAREAGKATTFTAAEAADALGYMSLAGWNVVDSTQALTPILRLAESTQQDLATTSDQVTDSMSALGLGIGNLGEYLDVVIQTNNKANTTASALMEAFIGCGGAARAANMSYKDTAVALGILANNGIKGAEAGTALNSMLVRISTKDVAQNAFKELGIAVYDSSGQMREMQDILIDLSKSFDGMTEAQKNNYMSAIAGTNYYSQFQYLINGVRSEVDGSASAWDSLSSSVENSNGALDKMNATVTSTLQASVARMKSAVSDLKISLVEDLGPGATEAIDGIAGALPQVTTALSGIVKKIPVAKFSQSITRMSVSTLGFINRVLDGEDAAIALKTTLQEAFGGKMPETIEFAIDLMGDSLRRTKEMATFLLGQARAAIQAVKNSLTEYQPMLEQIGGALLIIREAFYRAFEMSKPAIEYIAQTALPAIISALAGIVSWAMNVIEKFSQWEGFAPTLEFVAIAILSIATATKIVTTAISLWTTVSTIATTATTAFGAAVQFLLSPVTLVIAAIAALIAIGVLLYKNWDVVKEKATQLGEWIVNVFNSMKEKCSEYIQAFADKFPAAFAYISSMFGAFKDSISNYIEGVKQIFNGVIQFVKGVFTGDWESALEGLKTIAGGVFKTMSSVVMAPLNMLKGSVIGVFDAINTATGGKLDGIKEKASDTWNSVKSTAGTVLNATKEVISEKLNNIKNAYDANGGGIKGIAYATMEAYKSYYTAGLSFVDKMTGGKLTDIKNSFANVMDRVVSSVKDGIERVKKIFDFSWSLPKIKMPHFTISGSFSLKPPSVPSFGVEWYKEGGIMTKPTAFGFNPTTGNTMVGGEAGAEAIVPLRELWKNMADIVGRTMRAGNDMSVQDGIKAVLQRMKDTAEGRNKLSVTELLGRLIPRREETLQPVAEGMTIQYAPVFHITGSNLTQDDVKEAERMSMEEFRDFMERYEYERRRTKF